MPVIVFVHEPRLYTCPQDCSQGQCSARRSYE